MGSPSDSGTDSSPLLDWRGVSLNELHGSDSPWGAPEFPLVSPAYNHSMLYHISSNGLQSSDRPPKAQIGQDKWDHDNVRMPCSDQSLYPVENEGTTILKKRWEIINEALKMQISNSEQLALAILSYNTKFKNTWRFRALHALFNDYLEEEETEYFFNVTLPEIAKLALQLPKLIQAPIPLLKQHKNRSISLSQQQISCLMANAFFCTFPRRNTTKSTSEYASYPHINFNMLYESPPSESVLEKLKCLCHYFRRVTIKVPVGVMTFMRRSVPPRSCPNYSESTTLIGGTPLHVNSSGKIEDDGLGLIQVDFANKYLGGGVLGRGCVQEEIRFVICPELMLSMLFTEVLRPNEAVIMIGCERYSSYTGYGGSFKWGGDYVDPTPLDSSARRRCTVLAIDALPFQNKNNQYRTELIVREINKAWVGFSSYTSPEDRSTQRPGIATGNWGCGAFGGSPDLKFLLQLIAASEAGRPMAYYTFGDIELRNSLIGMYNLLAKHNVTVGELFKYIKQFAASKVPRSQLYEYIHQYILDNKSNASPNHTEKMDTSEPVSKTVESENRVQNSPDLFSQDETDNLNKDTRDNQTTMEQFYSSSQSTSKKKEGNKPSTGQTKRLFEEMSKFDEESGMVHIDINFPSSHNAPTHYDFRISDTTQNDIKNQTNNDTTNAQNDITNPSQNDTKSNSSNDIFSSPKEIKLTIETETSDERDEAVNIGEKRVSTNKDESKISDADVSSPRNISIHQNDVTNVTQNVGKDEIFLKSDISSDIKKQLTKKITDYFCKKT